MDLRNSTEQKKELMMLYVLIGRPLRFWARTYIYTFQFCNRSWGGDQFAVPSSSFELYIEETPSWWIPTVPHGKITCLRG